MSVLYQACRRLRLRKSVLSSTYFLPFSDYCQIKQAERLKSRERRAKVNRLDGQWAQWSIGLMVDRLYGR